MAELEKHDWLPFRQVAAQGNALIMVGHVILTQVDPQNPASFSKAVVDGIIRQGWGYQGVVVTDDLTMSAAYNHGLCHVMVSSLNAGVDLLLVSYDYEKYYQAMYCASRAYEDGQLDRQMLDISDKRLAALVK